jgi:hypothetical protein
MKRLTLPLILGALALAAPALAESTAHTQTGCALSVAENGNWLTYTGTCAEGEVISGGYTTANETRVDGCDTVTDRVTRESRGRREEARVEIARN